MQLEEQISENRMFENISGFTCPLYQMVVAKLSIQGHARSRFNQQPGRLKQLKAQ